MKSRRSTEPSRRSLKPARATTGPSSISSARKPVRRSRAADQGRLGEDPLSSPAWVLRESETPTASSRSGIRTPHLPVFQEILGGHIP